MIKHGFSHSLAHLIINTLHCDDAQFMLPPLLNTCVKNICALITFNHFRLANLMEVHVSVFFFIQCLCNIGEKSRKRKNDDKECRRKNYSIMIRVSFAISSFTHCVYILHHHHCRRLLKVAYVFICVGCFVL